MTAGRRRTRRLNGAFKWNAAGAAGRRASCSAEKIIKYWLMTYPPLKPLILMKKPVWKIHPCSRLLCGILSFRGVVFVGALCKKMGKTERAPASCGLFCRFRGADSLMHCSEAEKNKKKKHMHARSTGSNCQSTVHCVCMNSGILHSKYDTGFIF